MDYTLIKTNPLFKQHVVYMNRWDFLELAQQRDSHINRCATISFNDTASEMAQVRMLVPYQHGEMIVLLVKDDESMDHNTAESIFQFVKDNRHLNFVVHCFAGASRSVAVAKWIGEYLQLDDPSLQEEKHYNQHIYNLLKQIQREGE